MTADYIVCISALNKSEMWVIKLLQHRHPELGLELNRNVFLIDDLAGFELDAVENVVIFDDGSFSGIHMITMVEDIKAIMDVNVYIVTGLTTHTALSNLSFSGTPRKNVYYGECLTNNLGTFLSDDELDAIRRFYRLEEGDNDIPDFYPVFFDHKMPGIFSSVPFIYAGLIPKDGEDGDGEDDAWEEYPLIIGCEKGTYLSCPPVPYRGVKDPPEPPFHN